jgi:uncharacterized protein YcfL
MKKIQIILLVVSAIAVGCSSEKPKEVETIGKVIEVIQDYSVGCKGVSDVEMRMQDGSTKHLETEQKSIRQILKTAERKEQNIKVRYYDYEASCAKDGSFISAELSE